MALQHFRSSTANKRPNPASMADGQIALNTAADSPGLFYKDSAGNLVKAGPVHVGSTAPNVSPASGGTAGNSTGESWLDTSGSNPLLKVWNGSSWQTVQPVTSGTVVSTADTGSVTSTMIADGTIVNADVNASAAIAGTKISPDFGSQNATTTGTSTAASFIPTSSTVPTNGVYLPAANSVALATNGTGRLFVNSLGQVSIGTSSPSIVYRATINGDGATYVGGLSLRNNGTETLTIGTVTAADADNSEVWNPRSGYLRFATNNTERLRITSDGKVGVGTSSPSHLLSLNQPGTTAGEYGMSIAQAAASSNKLELTVDTSNNIAKIHQTSILPLTFWTNGSRAVTIDSSQRVGIGTTAPAHRTHIKMSGSDIYGFALEAISNDSKLTFGNYTSEWRIAATYGTTGSYQPIAFYTSDLERGRWDTSGRFLVGTSTSVTGSTAQYSKNQVIGNSANSAGNAVLVVGRGAAAASISSGNAIGSFFFTDNAAGEFASIECFADAAPGSSDYPGRLVFSTTKDAASSPTEALRIDSSQRVLIGTTSQVGSNTTRVDISAAGGSSEYGLGIDVTTLNTATQWIEFSSGGSTARGSIDWSGSAVRYNTSSDYRLKENVAPLVDSISRIKALKPCRYNFVEFPDQTVDGFIAHEAQVVVPEAVTGTKDEVNADGNPVYQGIDQSKLVPLLTAALQEALAEIESLKARVTALEP